ncbi:MAG TPA: hypothetical protein DCX14_07440 [Flavobacteriales bacterium]|nr:tetratricopeptide repeat protein [Flavobacteriales bacterium]HAW19998.1 hypothetical protein [Flavobacteriales bacterium]
MARREKQRYQKNTPAETPIESKVELVESSTPKASIKSNSNRIAMAFIFVFGVALYANTINFGFTLDDKLYITANEYTKKGFDGIAEIWTNDMMTGFFGKKKNLVEGGRYRPLALTTHAIEWEIFGKNARVAHFNNIILYGLTGVILLLVLQQIFKRESRDRWWWTLPVIATMLFLAHPTHTEVGANVKSRDEIMSVLFALLTMHSLFNYLKRENAISLVMSAVWFWLSLASKESSVTFLGVVPLTLIFFTNVSIKRGVVLMMPMIIATGAYLALRVWILGEEGGSLEVAQELMNKPYLNATGDERLASIFFTMALYLKLLVWPHPLTHDYYPFHPFATYEEMANGASGYVGWNEPMALISVLIYLVIFGYGVFTLLQRIRGKAPSILGYGALFYLGTFILFSNLFFDIGAFMNERFLFIPSLGFTIILAWLLVEKLGSKAGMIIAAVLILGYSAKTIDRNGAWKSDKSLAMADVGVSDGSAKVKMTMGSELLDEAKEPKNASRRQQILKEAEKYELQSLKIYPGYFPPLDILGNIYFEMENYAYSVHYFKGALRKKPYDKRMRNNMEAVANMAIKGKQHEAAIDAYLVLAKLYKGSERSRMYSALGEVYGKELNDLPNAMKFLKKAREADGQNAGVYQKMGIVYAMTNQRDSAMVNFTKAYKLDPDNARVLLNLGILYKQLGQNDLGEEYMRRAQEIDPTVVGSK